MFRRFAIRTVLYAALLVVILTWIDGRIDRRVEESIARAVQAVVHAQRAEISRLRALAATELRRSRQQTP